MGREVYTSTSGAACAKANIAIHPVIADRSADCWSSSSVSSTAGTEAKSAK